MKKTISKIGLLALILCLVFSLSGCGSKDNDSNKDSKSNSSENSTESTTESNKEDLKVFEYMDKIKPENTVEEINSIIGSDGELVDEKYNKYYWKLSENVGIEVAYYSSTKGTIKLDIDKSKIAIKNVDFSKYNELKDKVKSGITYDEFKTYLGNIDGVIVEKSSYSTKYTWASENGSYINGTFSNSSNKCTLLSGVVK